jgi:hypothetical protein
MTDIETRYKALIQPIRDLAQNFEVDVSEELGEYLEQLYTFDIRANTKGLNFAEAALLIQGSAAIYGRKVEYLHQLVLQALELISTQKSDKGGNAAGGQQSTRHASSTSFLDDERILFGNDEAYLLLDDLIEEGTNITLDTQKEKMLLKEKRRSSAGKMSFSADTSRASMILMHSILQEDHGGSNLKLSSCRMDKSGALMMAGLFANTLPSTSAGFGNVSMISNGHANDSMYGFGNNNMVVDEEMRPANNSWHMDDYDDNFDFGEPAPNSHDRVGEAASISPKGSGTPKLSAVTVLPNAPAVPPVAATRVSFGENVSAVSGMSTDSAGSQASARNHTYLAMLDSHESLTTSKPICKAKTFKIPSNLPPLGGRTDLRTSNVHPRPSKQVTPAHTFHAIINGKAPIQGIAHRHFEFIVKKQRQMASSARMIDRLHSNRGGAASGQPVADLPQNEIGMWNNDFGGDDGDFGDYYGGSDDVFPGEQRAAPFVGDNGDNVAVPTNDQAPQGFDGGFDGGFDDFAPALPSNDIIETEEEWLARRVEQALSEELILSQNVTYESLCRKHIDSFMLGAERYAR